MLDVNLIHSLTATMRSILDPVDLRNVKELEAALSREVDRDRRDALAFVALFHPSVEGYSSDLEERFLGRIDGLRLSHLWSACAATYGFLPSLGCTLGKRVHQYPMIDALEYLVADGTMAAGPAALRLLDLHADEAFIAFWRQCSEDSKRAIAAAAYGSGSVKPLRKLHVLTHGTDAPVGRFLPAGARVIERNRMTSQWELYESIHEATHEAIADCRWYDWDEDFITRTILRSLRGIHVTVQPTDDMPVQIEIRPWKLTGNREATFGDIAILVNISFHDGTCLEGAAFLAWIFA